jgi:hypothetical protein
MWIFFSHTAVETGAEKAPPTWIASGRMTTVAWAVALGTAAVLAAPMGAAANPATVPAETAAPAARTAAVLNSLDLVITLPVCGAVVLVMVIHLAAPAAPS